MRNQLAGLDCHTVLGTLVIIASGIANIWLGSSDIVLTPSERLTLQSVMFACGVLNWVLRSPLSPTFRAAAPSAAAK